MQNQPWKVGPEAHSANTVSELRAYSLSYNDGPDARDNGQCRCDTCVVYLEDGQNVQI